jgi:hypothetical protein
MLLMAESAFLYDQRPTFDYCANPELLRLHGSLSFDYTHETQLRPVFQLSKFVRNPEFLTTPLEAYDNHTSQEAQKKNLPWGEKTENRLFWRGSGTGDSYSKRKNYDWRRSHRPRLHLLAQATEGKSDIWVKRKNEWEKESWSNGVLNQKYLDVGLTGKPNQVSRQRLKLPSVRLLYLRSQCKQEDGTCDEMAGEINYKDRVTPEVAAKYKCELHVAFSDRQDANCLRP